MFQARTRTGFGFGRCRVRLPLPGSGRNLVRVPLSAAHASLLSQPNDRHVRLAWRSLRARRRPAFARGFVRRCRRLALFLRARQTCFRSANGLANDTQKIRNIDSGGLPTRAPTERPTRTRSTSGGVANGKTDPAYRQRRLTSLHAYRDARKDEIKERQRRRYKTEPGYREKLVARAKQYQHTRDPQHRPPYDPDYQRKRRLKFVYGISPEEYDAMLARQDGVCAICRNKPDKDKPLCVDHCHVTGEVRGLLCHRCNSALGFFREDSGILSTAIAYLQAARDRDRNVTERDTAGASGQAMRPPDIVAADAKPYDSGVT
jgi:Recombination endonuclease VII